VEVGGERFEVLPEEVEVRAEARAGLVVASEGAYLAALKTDLTPELVKEGLGREFVRRVQDQRKQAGFEIADRIHLFAQASALLAEALQAHREYIMGETLALKFEQTAPPAGASVAEFEFDGERVKVGLVKVV
jgi:isoleucyl-tRNA synthetase